jgi:hypothetical protein
VFQCMRSPIHMHNLQDEFTDVHRRDSVWRYLMKPVLHLLSPLASGASRIDYKSYEYILLMPY